MMGCLWKTRFPRASIAFSKTASYGRFPSYSVRKYLSPPASDSRLRALLFLPILKSAEAESCGMALHVFYGNCRAQIGSAKMSLPAAPHRHVAKQYADAMFQYILMFCGLRTYRNCFIMNARKLGRASWKS